MGEDRNMSKDWIQDEALSADEKRTRFEALNPEPTRGPSPFGGIVAESFSRGSNDVNFLNPGQSGAISAVSAPVPV